MSVGNEGGSGSVRKEEEWGEVLVYISPSRTWDKDSGSVLEKLKGRKADNRGIIIIATPCSILDLSSLTEDRSHASCISSAKF